MAGTGVKATHADYDAFAPKWARCRAVIAGQDAMQAARETFLPKLQSENDDAYRARIKRSDFFNGTWRTIDALSGMAFRKPPQIDVPPSIDSYLDDVTMSGVTMESFAKDTTEEVLSVGRVGILVDHPAPPENVAAITVAAAQQLGLRPTLQIYTTESIRNWKCARVNNAWVLTMVVLGEHAAVPKDEFSDTMEDRYRVLDLDNGTYRQRLFGIDKDGKEVLLSETVPLMNGKPLTSIPFRIVGANGLNDTIDEPPLIDLVDKNVAHYQVNSDYRHGLHFAGLPTLFLAGVQNDDTKSPIYIGGSAAITSDHPEARGEFIEFTGQGLTPMENALNRIERQMAMLGARMIADETVQAETLGATQIKRAGENSVLSKIIQGVSEALQWALGVFSEWAGAGDAEIQYEINRDFIPAMIDGQQLVALTQSLQAGGMSKREYFDVLQRGDVIDGDKTFEEHQEELASDPAPARPTPNPLDNAAAA